MSKKYLVFLFTLLIFTVLTTSLYAEESLDDILYGDFKEVETFGYINVKVQKEQPLSIDISSQDLTNFARLKYKNNFATIPFKEIPAQESYLYQEEEKAKKVGSIWLRVWTVGVDFPISFYIECRAGTYKDYDIWREEKLGYCSKDELNQVVRNEITKMIENLAITFFKVRKEI